MHTESATRNRARKNFNKKNDESKKKKLSSEKLAKKVLSELDTEEATPGPIKLPSRFQIGDQCAIRFTSLFVPSARVSKVLFSKGKVLYDLEVYLGSTAYTRIHSVDSAIVEDYVYPEARGADGVWESLEKGPRLDPNKKH